MITYVINTSENKTFDSDHLFKVADYNKIRWMNCTLDKIHECAEEIYLRQDTLGVDDFRIAVIVDFFGFDRIRIPYGREGYKEEIGVDLSLYMPYIEIFLADNLLGNLERREMFAADYEIFYIQNSKFERFEHLDNVDQQLRYILEGNEVSDEDGDSVDEEKVKAEEKSEKKSNKDSKPKEQCWCNDCENCPSNCCQICEYHDTCVGCKKKLEQDSETTDAVKEPLCDSFTLYCTKRVSLQFNLTDYPYGAIGQPMTFTGFFHAFRQRASAPTKLRRHYYKTSFGSGPVRAAFDALSLSLYLIRIYEREEMVELEGEIDIPQMDANALREILSTSWMRISAAREQASENHSEYYSLYQNRNEIRENLTMIAEMDEETAILKERAALNREDLNVDRSAISLYNTIVKFDEKTDDTLTAENKEEFNKIFNDYLIKRDETNEKSVEEEFNRLQKMGALATTDQCPSHEQYVHAVNERHQSISELFQRALGAEYIDVDYSEERAKAEIAYQEYNKWKACIHKNIIGDIIFLILVVMVMIIPYKRLQIGVPAYVNLGNHTLLFITSVVFGLAFAASFIINTLIPIWRMRAEKKKLENYYMDCLAKRRYSFSSLRRRYEKDLIRIEEARYEVRQIKHIHEANLAKERRITNYRLLLESLHDKVSSMLNNLGVEPVYDPEVVGTEYFDINKILRNKDKQIYQVFSVETIERLFPKKRGGN